MDDKKAANVLMGILKKHSLNEEEKVAVHAAIGVLSWTALAQSRLKSMKARRIKKNIL